MHNESFPKSNIVVLARHQPPGGRWFGALPRTGGAVPRLPRSRGDLPHRLLPGSEENRARPARRLLAEVLPRRGKLERLSPRAVGAAGGPARPAGRRDRQDGNPGRGRRYPKRCALLRLPRRRGPHRGAHPPLPPRAVVRRGPGALPDRLARGIQDLPADPPPQPLGHGLATLGGGIRRAGRAAENFTIIRNGIEPVPEAARGHSAQEGEDKPVYLVALS